MVKSMVEGILRVTAYMLLSAFGDLVRQLYIADKAAVKIAGYISNCVVAAFIGLMIFFVTEHFEFNQNLAYAAAGICGWIGPQLLDRLSGLVLDLAGLTNLKGGGKDNKPDKL